MSPDDLASAGYRAQLGQLTDAWGGGGAKHAKEIAFLAENYNAKTILDYGCGPGSLKRQLAGFRPQLQVAEYDPGYEEKAALPTPADLVACVDVLEHVEPDRLKAVLTHIFDLTNKVAFFVIATRPAEKRLPDGRNAHLIIDNANWWVEQLRTFNWLGAKIKLSAPGAHGSVKVWFVK